MVLQGVSPPGRAIAGPAHRSDCARTQSPGGNRDRAKSTSPDGLIDSGTRKARSDDKEAKKTDNAEKGPPRLYFIGFIN